MIKAVGYVGCDGTAVNTGIRGGIIRLLEVALNRPLQWFVCQLHANELPLKHLNGPTTGPHGFSSPIMPIGNRKSLPNCEKLPIVDFEPLNCVLPPSINSDDFLKVLTKSTCLTCYRGISITRFRKSRRIH